MTLRKYLAPAIGAFLLLVHPVFAVPLPPGGVIFPTGTTVAANPSLGGAIIADDLIAFAFDPTPSTPLTTVGGNVQNRVTARNSTNFLTFVPRIRDTFNTDGGTFGITGFRLTGYGDAILDVDFRTDSLGHKGFTSVSRSADGDLMTFRYGDPLLIDAAMGGLQEESLFPSIVTQATEFELTGTMTIFGQLFDVPVTGAPPTATSDLFSVTLTGIAVPKVAPVPLPAGAVLMLGVVGAFGVMRKRKA